jgi:murein DD-endopeptidase MepM/ murein hydrolase activator NlpD
MFRLARLTLAALLFGGACSSPVVEAPRVRLSDIFLEPDTELLTGRVPRNATLDGILRSSRLRDDIVPAVVELAGSVFDLRRLKADNPFKLERTLDGLLRTFEYEIDGDRFLRIIGASDRRPDGLTVELVPYRKERGLVSLSGSIDRDASSLFVAMERAGEGPDLSIELASIFGGEIDFNSDLQPGDSFRLTFEKVFREGRASGYGRIRAAEFNNDGRVLKAILYTLPDGKPAYYDEQGRSLRRFFLKSPLKFEASVSSRFSYARRHPVLRIVRPHLGVDYRAPAGSSVVAVANGTVLSAGWNAGAGRMIHLRHASGYETMYLHLSSVGVRRGQHVSQGQLIGRVGSTGLSTGPHLDYRVKKDGRFLNPLQVHRSLPPGEPIPAALLADFRDKASQAWATLVSPGPRSADPVAAAGEPLPSLLR